MRPRFAPAFATPTAHFNNHLRIVIDPQEVFTTRSLCLQLLQLREQFEFVDLVTAKGTDIQFEVRHYRDEYEQIQAQLAELAFDYAVDAEADPEAMPTVLFLSEREEYGNDVCCAMFEPDQPLTTRSFQRLYDRLGPDKNYLGFEVNRPYLTLRDGSSSGYSPFRYEFVPRYHTCMLDVRCEAYDNFRYVWVTVTGYSGFDLATLRVPPNIVDIQQISEHQVRARIGGLLTHPGLMLDFVGDNVIWNRAFDFAKALGYHPDVTEFRLHIDNQRSLCLLPDAVSDLK